MIINPKSIRNILIINLKYIGDLIVATPVYETVRNNFPASKISLLLQKGYEKVVDENKNLDELIPCDLKYLRSLNGIKRIKEEIKFFRVLRKQKFDLSIVLHPTDRPVLWSFFCGAKYRVAPKKQSFSYLLTHPVDVEEESKSYLEYYLDIVRALGTDIKSKQTYFYISPESGAWSKKFIEDHHLNSEHIIGIHPGASLESKRWDIQKYMNLINKVSHDSRIKILLFQGPNERELVDSIYNLCMKSRDNIFIADCSENIQYLGALMKYCRLVICNDSSSRHIAAALKVKSITLFSREKYHCWKIYDEKDMQFDIIGDWCQECRIGYCTGDRCLKSISEEIVLKKINEVLAIKEC